MSKMKKEFCALWMIGFLFLSVTSLIAANSNSELVEAAKKGDGDSVYSLLTKDVDVNTAQLDGTTALHWAAHLNDLKMATLLIEAGANVNVSNDYGITPLSLACTNGSSRMVRGLLQAGADPNSCLLYTSPSPRDATLSRMPSSA